MSVTAPIPPLSNCMSAWPFKVAFCTRCHFSLRGKAFIQACKKSNIYTGRRRWREGGGGERINDNRRRTIDLYE